MIVQVKYSVGVARRNFLALMAGVCLVLSAFSACAQDKESQAQQMLNQGNLNGLMFHAEVLMAAHRDQGGLEGELKQMLTLDYSGLIIKEEMGQVASLIDQSARTITDVAIDNMSQDTLPEVGDQIITLGRYWGFPRGIKASVISRKKGTYKGRAIVRFRAVYYGIEFGFTTRSIGKRWIQMKD